MIATNPQVREFLLAESADACRFSAELAQEHQIQDHLTCWHFSAVEGGSEPEFEKALLSLDEAITSNSIIRPLYLSIELWDRALPSHAWLIERLPEIERVADHLGVLIEGWSYEPRKAAGKGIPQIFFPLVEEVE